MLRQTAHRLRRLLRFVVVCAPIFGLVGAANGAAARSVVVTDQSSAISNGAIVDPVGDVGDARGDLTSAMSIGNVIGLLVTIDQFEDVSSDDWRLTNTRVLMNIDLDGDGKTDDVLTYSWVEAGQTIGAVLTNAKGELLCLDGADPRVNADQHSIGFSVYDGCLGFPTKIWWQAEFHFCDVGTGVEAVDHVPDDGWVGPQALPSPGVGAFYPVTPSYNNFAPRSSCIVGGTPPGIAEPAPSPSSTPPSSSTTTEVTSTTTVANPTTTPTPTSTTVATSTTASAATTTTVASAPSSATTTTSTPPAATTSTMPAVQATTTTTDPVEPEDTRTTSGAAVVRLGPPALAGRPARRLGVIGASD